MQPAAGSRFDPASRRGHYESWFVRANHPDRPLALWTRYTVFAPKGVPEAATAGLWAAWFDGEQHTVVQSHREHPIADGFRSTWRLDVRIGESELTANHASGSADRISWDFLMAGPSDPVLTEPPCFYGLSFPPAKSLAVSRSVSVGGSVSVDGVPHSVDGWVGAIGHNWGSRLADEYAWTQVSSFDGVQDGFLECQTVRFRALGLSMPWVTTGAVHIDGEAHRFLSLYRGLSSSAPYSTRTWQFKGRGLRASVEGVIQALDEPIAAFDYRNPPGGVKKCLNSGLASAKVLIKLRGKVREFTSRKASLEILQNPEKP